MRFFQAIFLGVFLLSNAEGKEVFHVKGPFDLDKDKASECLVLNSEDYSILFVEINSSGVNDTIWSYKFENEITIADGDFIDLDNDGVLELIIIPNIINVDKDSPWLYVFRGLASGFINEPLSYTEAPLSLTAMRPSSLTILSDPFSPLGVCFASPVRKGMIFNLRITEGQLKLINPRLLSSSSNNNGYGAIQMSSFSSKNRDYISILSVEKDSLHTTIFDAEDNYNLVESKSISFNSLPLNLETPIMSRTSENDGKDGLLLPISSDDVFLLRILDSEIMIFTTNISKHNAFPTNYKSSLHSILKSRENVVALKPLEISLTKPFSRFEASESPPIDKNLFPKINNVEKTIISSNKNQTNLPKTKQKLFYQKTKKFEDQKNIIC